jgi:putative (di)nucleoside polyphosphate hydrolase
VVLVNPAGLVFAGRRIDGPAEAWQMPQGGIDEGEKPRAAALRELREETGVTADLVTPLDRMKGWLPYDLPPDLVGRIWGGRFRGQKQKWFLYRFDGPDSAIAIATEHPEFAEWAWMRADDIATRIVPFKRAVYDQVFAAFRRHLA